MFIDKIIQFQHLDETVTYMCLESCYKNTTRATNITISTAADGALTCSLKKERLYVKHQYKVLSIKKSNWEYSDVWKK